MEIRIVTVKGKLISDFLQVNLLSRHSKHLLRANSNRFLVEFLSNKLNNLLIDNLLLNHHNNNKDKIEILAINNNNKYLHILVLEIISNKTLSHHLEVLDRIGRNQRKTVIVPPRKKNSLRKTQANIGNKKETKYSRKDLLIQLLNTTQER